MKIWLSFVYGISFMLMVYLVSINIKSTINIHKYTNLVLKSISQYNLNMNHSMSGPNIVKVTNTMQDQNFSRLTTLKKLEIELKEYTTKGPLIILNYSLQSHSDTAYSGFHITKAKLKLLPNFKNPCWVERYTGNYVYLNNVYLKRKKYPLRKNFGKKLRMVRPKGVTVQLQSGSCAPPHTCRIRCLPYFMLIGVAKSGTSDFTNRIKLHPQIFPPLSKELYWWTQYRFNSVLGANLGEYADLFDMSTRKLTESNIRKDSKDGTLLYEAILGEFTSMTFFDFSHWRKDPKNENQNEPINTVARDIYKILPNIKLIVILRNPTTRLYSSYNMFNRKRRSPKDFHRRVLGSILWWNTCVKRLPERNCAYGSPPNMPPVYDSIGKRNKWWPRDKNYTGEIRHGMYGLIVKDWLDVFPRKSMLFIRMEDYSRNLTNMYNNYIFPFLNVGKLNDKLKIKKLQSKRVASKLRYKPMLRKTRRILDNFYAPFNQRLANYLKDKKWLWKDV